MRRLIGFALACLVGCSGLATSEVHSSPNDTSNLTMDYQLQDPKATGPNGERLVSGLYTDWSAWYAWGCSLGYQEPSVAFEEDEIDLMVLGSCSASYRRAGPVWYTAVEGYFRLIDMGPEPATTADALIEFGVRHDGYAAVEIVEIMNGTETSFCSVNLDSRDAREDACTGVLDKRAWYKITIAHTERLPESYVAATIMGGVRMQFSLPWGLGVEHYTDFDIGGEPQERLLAERACPEIVPVRVPATNPQGTLHEGLAAQYFAYDDYACSVFETDALTQVCGADEPNLRIRTGATDSWSVGDFMSMRYNSPTQNPTACEIATGETRDWVASMSGYFRVEALDEQAPDQLELTIDGDVNDGFRLTVYDWQTGEKVCHVDGMWSDAPGHWNYHSITARYGHRVGADDCERPHTFKVGALYPVIVEYYHHKTGGSRDTAELDVWWRGMIRNHVASALYHE